MSAAISQQISLFRSQIQKRRFNDEALQILELVLLSRDVRSLLEIRSAVRDLLRSELTSVLAEIAAVSTFEKLLAVDFFVKAFALVGDTESCLALKYEALVLRETKRISDPGLQVSYEEWYSFAKDSLDNGFYAIAIKGFESALLCVQSHKSAGPALETYAVDELEIDHVKKLRDMAMTLVASHSVYTESSNYLKRKAEHDEERCISTLDNKRQVMSITFRNAIKKRNMRLLQQSQGLPQEFSGF